MRSMLAAMLFTTLPALAQSVPLSSLFDTPSGEAAFVPDPPFVTVVDVPVYGVGINCPGDWTSVAIQFSDTQPLEHGLGQHPQVSGATRVDFDLAAIAAANNAPVVAFTGRVGIEVVTSAFENGATFEVFVDGVSVYTQTVAGRSSPSVPFDISLAGASTLSLRTTRAGNFNSNHACWGLAALTLGQACDSIDYNGDGLFPDNQDLVDYLSVFGGSDCPSGSCGDLDFNNDGLFPDNEDIFALFRVFGGGAC